MAYGPQNNLSPEFEKHTQNHEISTAALNAYVIMRQAVHNADLGLIPALEEYKKPIEPVRELDPLEENHPRIADFEAYRQRKAAAQTVASVAVVAENRTEPVPTEQIASVTDLANYQGNFLEDDTQNGDVAQQARDAIDRIHADTAAENNDPAAPENPWGNHDAA